MSFNLQLHISLIQGGQNPQRVVVPIEEEEEDISLIQVIIQEFMFGVL